MDEDIADLKPLFENTHNGAGVWGTFRWLSSMLYAACWIVALPAELVLNRRVGARYAGLLPVTISFFLLGMLFATAGSLRSPLLPAAKETASASDAMWTVLIAEGVFILAVIRNRIANWMRFRSEDQVHSLSNGVPFWLNPPRFASETVVSMSNDLREMASADYAAQASGNAQVVRGHVSGFFQEWRSGLPPTGPIAWILATVVHPALLVAGSVPLAGINPAAGYYLFIAGVMIFLKARIQKALVVEKVYDLFDTRLEQEFTLALGNPVKAQNVERAGMIVPGIARVLSQGPSDDDGGPGRGSVRPKPSPLSPDVQSLLGRPSSMTEPKSAARASVVSDLNGHTNGAPHGSQNSSGEGSQDEVDPRQRIAELMETIAQYEQSKREEDAVAEPILARTREALRRGVSIKVAMSPEEATRLYNASLGMDIVATPCPNGCVISARNATPPPIPTEAAHPVVKHGIGSGGIIGPGMENVSAADASR